MHEMMRKEACEYVIRINWQKTLIYFDEWILVIMIKVFDLLIVKRTCKDKNRGKNGCGVPLRNGSL